jgi:hypothetical protein
MLFFQKKLMYPVIMEDLNILRLNLVSPLMYARLEEPVPLPVPGEALPEGEGLFCFELNPAQAGSIEPEEADYLGPLVFQGSGGSGGPPVELPAGWYYFAQARRVLNREEILCLALEVQKEALWERQTPEPRLYLRYLSEDGTAVTQVWRPVREEAG